MIWAAFESVRETMRNISSLNFWPRMTRDSDCTRSTSVVVAKALVYLISMVALFGICESLCAQEKAAPAEPVPAVKPHVPLAGKACIECHKRVAASKVNCLLAKEALCEFCHQIPAEGGPSRLVEASEPLCFQCHKKSQFKGKFIHGAFAVGACITCHDPHGGNVPGMLRTADPAMCLQCHKDMSARLVNARFQHKPAVTGCMNCHSPHMSEQRYMLRTEIPGLCGTCHENVVKDLQAATVKHSPVTEEPACMNCHDPHAAQNGKLLLADGIDICLQCHDKAVDKAVKAGKEEVADMKQVLAANPYPHGPIQNRDCSACHNPHGSSYFRLLTNQYPQNFYAPFFVSNYDLCFRCHDAALAKEERTTSATGFRDGDRNLHFVHVNRKSHGRTCRSCHEVHASATPELIGATVPFGNWKLPIKFEKTENGGSCAPACHAVQKYDRRPAKTAQ